MWSSVRISWVTEESLLFDCLNFNEKSLAFFSAGHINLSSNLLVYFFYKNLSVYHQSQTVWIQMGQTVCKRPPELKLKYLQTPSPPKSLVQIQNNFTEMFLIMPSTKMVTLPWTKLPPELKIEIYFTSHSELLVQNQNHRYVPHNALYQIFKNGSAEQMSAKAYKNIYL